MSETDDMKKAVLESKVKQQMDAVIAHINYLNDMIETRYQEKKDSQIIYGVAWLAWVISAFFGDEARYIMVCIFLGTVFYDNYRFSRLQHAFGEFDGTMKTLRILGIIPPLDEPGERKKRKFWSEMVDVVKGWAITKKKAQDAVYAPA